MIFLLRIVDEEGGRLHGTTLAADAISAVNLFLSRGDMREFKAGAKNDADYDEREACYWHLGIRGEDDNSCIPDEYEFATDTQDGIWYELIEVDTINCRTVVYNGYNQVVERINFVF